MLADMATQTKAQITQILKTAKTDAYFEVVFAPLTAPCWLVNVEGEVDCLGDALQDPLDSSHLVAVVHGRPLTLKVDRWNEDGFWLSEEEGDYLCVTANHIQSIKAGVPTKTEVSIHGLGYKMILNSKDGTCKVGCQTLTRKGCDEAFRALAAHLGYDIEN